MKEIVFALALGAATTLSVLLDPRLAKAVTISQVDMPAAHYTNDVGGAIVNDPNSSQHQGSALPSTGLSVSGSGQGLSGPTLFNASTSNDYSIPRVSASALANAGATAAALSIVNYFVAFSGSDGTIPVDIQAFGDVNSTGGRAFLQLTFQKVENGVSVFDQTYDITGGSQVLSLNQTYMLDANTLYRVIMDTEAFSLGSGGAASVHLDPFFVAPDGYSVLTSDGIGNASPVAATPLPAALPLFAGGIGLIGLLARRRKRKAALAA